MERAHLDTVSSGLGFCLPGLGPWSLGLCKLPELCTSKQGKQGRRTPPLPRCSVLGTFELQPAGSTPSPGQCYPQSLQLNGWLGWVRGTVGFVWMWVFTKALNAGYTSEAAQAIHHSCQQCWRRPGTLTCHCTGRCSGWVGCAQGHKVFL